jgi:hypothetical protein
MSLEINYTGSDGRPHRDLAGLLKAETESIVQEHLAALEIRDEESEVRDPRREAERTADPHGAGC